MKINTYYLYLERSSTLSHYATLYAFTIILIAQFIYLNFHYIIGGILTIFSLLTIFFQILFNSIEKYHLDKRNIITLDRIWNFHFWINKIFICINIPFFIWAMILMFNHK